MKVTFRESSSQWRYGRRENRGGCSRNRSSWARSASSCSCRRESVDRQYRHGCGGSGVPWEDNVGRVWGASSSILKYFNGCVTAARRPLRPLRRRAAHGDGARRARARRPPRPAPSQPPHPGPGRSARPRGRLVALGTPRLGVGAGPAAAPRRPPSQAAGGSASRSTSWSPRTGRRRPGASRSLAASLGSTSPNGCATSPRHSIKSSAPTVRSHSSRILSLIARAFASGRLHSRCAVSSHRCRSDQIQTR